MKTSEKILKVAADEFARIGYDGLSMNSLVEKLEINKATVYYHFKDKKALYKEVIKHEMKKNNDNVKTIFKENKDPENLFKSYINAHILSIKKNPNIVQIALREIANFGADVDEEIIPYIEEDINFLKLVLDDLNLKEKYKQMNLFSIFSLIQGTIKTFYAIQMSDLPIGLEEGLKKDSEKSLNHIAEFISNILLDAIVEK
jgi:hypothetical protein